VKGQKRPAPPPARGAAVSPVARILAKEKGLDLGRIRGTGPGGRIVLADVEGATPEKRSPPPSAEAGEKPERAAGKSVKIRRIVARKMLESWQNIPHFFVTVAVDMTDVIRFRKDIEVSINDFIVAATTRSLHEHPWVNSLWIDGEAVEQESINIAMAVATERGLYNPVIHDCGKLSLKEIGRRARDLADKAHFGKLAHADMEGGTFTISNMGMLGVESFSAIITPPQAAVLAVGTVKGEVVVDDQGEPGIAPILRLTLSADHRTLDGADAAEFLGTLKSYLEAPVTLVTCNYGQEKE
jgi:pyruvate dehydrogenase E2 component (dihydrolipoamide acetyltransferase)